MRDSLKNLIEHASIDLAYARAEISMAETMGDEKAARRTPSRRRGEDC